MKAKTEFDKLYNENHGTWFKILQKYSVSKLEALACSAPSSYEVRYTEKELVKWIFRVRGNKLNKKFKWTKENIERIITVSDTFLKSWEEGFNRAKKMIDLLYANCENKTDFFGDYWIEIELSPSIVLPDKETGELLLPDSGIYSVINDYLCPSRFLTMDIRREEYNPETKDDSGFRKNLYINHDTNWNVEGFGEIELAEYYLCYAMHALYDHCGCAFDDIMKINLIDIDVTMADQHGSSLF
jgi:hypothetical protein